MKKKIILCALLFSTSGTMTSLANGKSVMASYPSAATSSANRLVVVPSEQTSPNNGRALSNCGIKLMLTMSGITRIELESVDGYALAGKVAASSDGQYGEISNASSIIILKAPEGSTFQLGKDYFIYTSPLNLFNFQ